jgi:MinD-like ATPase involved in chromosome partitioning or flagellar assembly
MALIAIASDKGAPGVTTAALALAAVWPRPVLLAECDPAGGDLVYRFPAVGGGHLDPRRGVLSLAVVARRGMQPQQVWEHVQKLHGGLDVLAGVTNAEQGAGLSLLWGPIGKALASMPQADVIADCGRLGADGPLYDLLAEATTVVLVSKVHVADVIRLRDRAIAFAAAAQSRGRRNFGVGVVVVADHKKFRASLGEVQHVLGQANAPATVLGGIAHDTKGADLLNGEWGGNLDRTLLIKTAREVARQLVQGLPPIGNPAEPGPAMPAHAQPQPAHPQPAPRGVLPATGPQPPATGPHPGWSSGSPQPAVARSSGPAAPAPVPAMTLRGPAQPSPAQPSPAQPSPAQPSPAQHTPADLAAVTLSAPTVSDDAPRTTFSRVRGRPGRHQAEPGQAPNGQLPADQTSSSPARHRQEPGDRHGSNFSRAPMAPLSTSDAQAPAGLPEQEDAEDAGWGVTPWDRQGPAGSMGSRRSGGG